MRLTLQVFTPLGSVNPQQLDSVVFDTEQTSLEISTDIASGFAVCSVGVPPIGGSRFNPPYLPQRVTELTNRAHVVIKAGSATVFEGQVLKEKRVRGEPVGFTASGYASALKERFFSSADTTPSTSGAALQTIIQSLYPFLRIGNSHQYQDPGVTHSLSEFDGMRASQVADQIGHEGGTDGNVWDVRIWDNQTVHLLPRLKPAVPDFVVPYRMIDDETIDYEAYITRNSVTYDNAGTTTTTSSKVNAADEDTLNRIIDIVIDGGKLTSAAAAQFRDTYHAYYNQALKAVSLTLNMRTPQLGRIVERGLPLYLGGERPAWLVRAGEWIQPGDDSDWLYITGTDYSNESGQLRVTAGTYRGADMPDAYRHLLEVAASVVNRINPNTRAKNT